MTKYIGRKVAVGIGKESVRGTPVAPTFFTPHLELTLDDKITQAIDESTVARIEDTTDAKIVDQFTTGTIRGIVQDKQFGLWILALLGNVVTQANTPEAGVQTHTFSVLNDAQHPSLTLAEINDDNNLAYPLMMIDSFELSVLLANFITQNIGIRARKSQTASNTVAFTEENKFVPQHATFKVASNLAGLGAAPATKLKSLTLNITKNLEDDRNFGSVDQDDILNRQFVVEGSLELLFESNTFKDLVTGDTAQAMRIELENTDVTIGAATKPRIRIDLAKVKFSEIARSLTLNEIVRQTLTFKSFYSLSDAKSIEIEVINTQVSY